MRFSLALTRSGWAAPLVLGIHAMTALSGCGGSEFAGAEVAALEGGAEAGTADHAVPEGGQSDVQQPSEPDAPDPPPACVPLRCGDTHTKCGSVPDGCNGTLTCDACAHG